MARPTQIFIVLLISMCNFLNTASAQTLIFQSGFEPTTAFIGQGSSSTDLIGIDKTHPSANDWVTNLDDHPNIGTFTIQYQGGDASQRLAELVPAPNEPNNKTLHFWIREPNVDNGVKGRIQANIYGNTGLYDISFTVRLYLPNDFELLKNAPGKVTWLTLMEFWNDPNWIDAPTSFRVSVNLQKLNIAPDSLRIGVHGQTFDPETETFRNTIWDTVNTDYVVPVGQWMDLAVRFREGDKTTGRFSLDITTEKAGQISVIDIHNYTHHPDDPDPDGLSHFNPLKLYTSDALINYFSSMGGLMHVYWDDFVLWHHDTATELGIKGDFNLDGSVNFTDFLLFASAFGGTAPRFDLEGNGRVDFGDFLILIANFGRS